MVGWTVGTSSDSRERWCHLELIRARLMAIGKAERVLGLRELQLSGEMLGLGFRNEVDPICQGVKLYTADVTQRRAHTGVGQSKRVCDAQLRSEHNSPRPVFKSLPHPCFPRVLHETLKGRMA